MAKLSIDINRDCHGDTIFTTWLNCWPQVKAEGVTVDLATRALIDKLENACLSFEEKYETGTLRTFLQENGICL